MSCSPGKCVAENHKFKKKDRKDSPEKTVRPEKMEKLERTDSTGNGENAEKREARSKAGKEDVPPKRVEKISPRFSKEFWMELLSREESEKVVGDIMEYQMQRVMAGNLLVDIKRQRENYTAYWARNYILQKVTQELTCRDEGEDPEESSKTEDSELEPLTIDMWAPRCVPAQKILHSPEPVDEKEAEVERVRTSPVTRWQPKVPAPSSPVRRTATLTEPHRKNQTTSGPKQGVKKSPPRPPVSTTHLHVDSRKSAALAPVSDMRQDVDSAIPTDSPLSLQAASLQPRKSAKSLDPSSFPHHWILPQYEITDTPCTKPGYKATGGFTKIMKKNPTCKDGGSRRATDLRRGLSSKDLDRK
ncbi:uncharacterized protein LOC128763118 [Synchiropus splendidus]|uniref:uncharacterized protein LOC128763118 n=1 Tax=Synchiropus splendidus TaxID=270530 RepID=UPI00237DD210|nr:uncharacterized protein LOC128763118 [Synchiropus splendidus]